MYLNLFEQNQKREKILIKNNYILFIRVIYNLIYFNFLERERIFKLKINWKREKELEGEQKVMEDFVN